MKRPSWDEYFAELCRMLAARSTCLRAEHGALIVRDKRIIATGYNGSPAGMDNCSEGKCYRREHNIPSGQQYEKCRGIHAEQNAILQCACHGVSCEGATLYVTDVPCEICALLILGAGIKEVVFTKDSGRYSSEALWWLQKNGGIVRNLRRE